MQKKTKAFLDRFLSLDGAAAYWISGLLLGFFFLLYPQTNTEANVTLSQLLIFGSLMGSIATLFVLYYQGKLNLRHMIWAALVCGFCVKLGYAISTGYQVHQHDVESLGNSGHLQYIYQLATDGVLPDTNHWQFSHPPLHHMLAALVVKAGELLGFDQARCFESIQYLTVFYSTVTMIWFYKILQHLRVRGRALFFAVLLFAVHPTFTILAGSINNDMLTVMLCTGAVYYLLKWYDKPSYTTAAVLGLLTGLAMMTKFSAALMAAVIGIVVLIKVIKEQNSKLLLQAPVFLALCLPLGMWYQIRNMRLFSQPLGHVAPLDPSSSLYTGESSIFSRLLVAPLAEWKNVFSDPWNDVNLIGYTVKSSVFGEYSWDNTGLAWLLLLLNIAMIGLTIFAIVQVLRNKIQLGFGAKLILLLNFFVQIGFFVYFNLSYPFGCSMDFRYIVPTLVSGIALLGVVANGYQSRAKEDGRIHLGLSIFGGLNIAFFLLSMLLFV